MTSWHSTSSRTESIASPHPARLRQRGIGVVPVHRRIRRRAAHRERAGNGVTREPRSCGTDRIVGVHRGRLVVRRKRRRSTLCDFLRRRDGRRAVRRRWGDPVVAGVVAGFPILRRRARRRRVDRRAPQRPDASVRLGRSWRWENPDPPIPACRLHRARHQRTSVFARRRCSARVLLVDRRIMDLRGAPRWTSHPAARRTPGRADPHA